MGRLVLRCVAGLVLTMALPGLALAYVPDLSAIYDLLSARSGGLERAIIETRSTVFNPLEQAGEAPLKPGTTAEAVPVPMPDRTFRQKIYWIRDAFLGVQTLAEDGTPLHFYLDEGIAPVAADLTPTRHFVAQDVLPPFLPFLENSRAAWSKGMAHWGLVPSTVGLVRGLKDTFYYRLTGQPGDSLWVQPDTLRPVKLQTVAQGGGQPVHLTIEFQEFLTVVDGQGGQPDIEYPRVINYLLDGRLFKQTYLLSFQADPALSRFPVTAFRQRAKQLLDTAQGGGKSQEPRP